VANLRRHLYSVVVELLARVSVHPEGPATGLSTRVLLVFLCLQVNAEMVPKFHAATACFSCSLPSLN
jgi:hypothetical protein